MESFLALRGREGGSFKEYNIWFDGRFDTLTALLFTCLNTTTTQGGKIDKFETFGGIF